MTGLRGGCGARGVRLQQRDAPCHASSRCENLPYSRRERLKSRGWGLALDRSLPLRRRLTGARMILAAWWFRSVEARAGRWHPGFPAYAGAIVRGETGQRFPPEVLEALKRQYRPMAGVSILWGSYWFPPGSRGWREVQKMATRRVARWRR